MSSPKTLENVAVDHQKQADLVFTLVIVLLIVMVFVSDLMMPQGVVIYALYVIPLGLASWSSIRSLLPITGGVCSGLVIVGYVYSSPGASFDYVVINRALGIGMVLAVTFFGWAKRHEGAS